MNRRLFIFALAMTAGMACGNACAQTVAPIYGQVISQARGPVGGVTVSLVHPTLGRSTPVFTDSQGHYFFANVPSQGTYYLEAYWGNNLLYRDTVNYSGGSVSHNINLP